MTSRFRMNLMGLLLLAPIAVLAAPKVPAPPVAGSIVVSDAPYAWDKEVKAIARVGESQIFLLQTRGGSAGVGLLFGPLGVAANAKAVANKSAEMASNVSTADAFDIQGMIKAQLAAAGVSLPADATPVMTLAGALLIRSDLDNKMRSSLVVRVTDSSTRKGWSKGYFYHFAHVGDAAEFQADGGAALLAALRGELERATTVTTNIILDDLRGAFTESVPVAVSSDFMMPLGKARLAFKGVRITERDGVSVYRLDGKPGMLLFPTVDGVHLCQPGQCQEQAK